ncbi:helix-turn-helix domain-containing protein, partial [Phenylobacterium sp.]|uniref:helix-turn-helix domain-containing protein n=1 Tax=Phenylobacterium sp. TaxID=1871053 RepID=UPI0039C93025
MSGFRSRRFVRFGLRGRPGDRDATGGAHGALFGALSRYRAGAFSCVEAAEFLGLSERHFRRLRDVYEAEGAEGLIDKRRG